MYVIEHFELVYYSVKFGENIYSISSNILYDFCEQHTAIIVNVLHE